MTKTVTELVGSLSADEKYFCCEFFPPKTEQGVENLIGRCRRLVDLGALFVSVTWATGGASAEQTLQLATRFQREIGVPTVLHLTCTNMDREILDHALATAKAAGIRNVLALRGDPPRAEYKQQSELHCAKDLVAYIRKEYGDYFCIGVAGYAEGHADGAVSEQSVEKDMPFLVEKVQAGADFIITQLFYDAEKFIAYEKQCREHPSGVLNSMPIIPGLMPINSYPSLLRSAKLSSANIPPCVLQHFDHIDTKDDVQVKAAGVKIICDILQKLHESGTQGVHFYTLNLEKSVAEIVTKCNMVHMLRNEREELPSSVESLATWDDFTNGRYSDPRSAAFGEIDGYGPVIHGADNDSPNEMWGKPTKSEDISRMFVGHITNEIKVIPFSDQPLNAETSLIQEELIALNEKGFWTLSSQPSVSGAKSTDRIFGWGPPDGKVYQKAFVEFLCSSENWNKLKTKLGNESMTYFAANEKDDVESNAPKEPTAVTWGVWGERTAQSTFLTLESFTSWRDEAFDVLRQWQRLYPSSSESFKLLDQEASDRYLVTVAAHDMGDGLWEFLLN
ncbi:Methylenetetrahydrofolate reductase 2 [Wickerhamiella sorbophila]|uniref:Methylenetetrahydrofolate reductase 2 n=1 Tax=Wickerhamiella sorbophila TaxID=45607 RepID=A0A2T0FCZ1_9ASCO|nr:Methylenetetrahydrofolate reductase 2 [Wickerhamiella sorbophila]PRT52864.1 Methylenetetrahydrofolate reductase 2 [Wickerhamiella sorbophila]